MVSLQLRWLLLLTLTLQALASIKEELDWGDLDSFDTSPHDVVEVFHDQYGVWPEGIALNGETKYYGPYPTITDVFSRPCYKILGDITFESPVDVEERNVTIASGALYNFGSTKSLQSIELLGSWTESASLEVRTKFPALRFRKVLPVTGAFDMGLPFALSTASRNRSMVHEKMSSSLISIDVPPKSLIRVDMVATMKTQTMDFEAPVQVEGDFGANFSIWANRYLLLFFTQRPEKGTLRFYRGRFISFLPANEVMNMTKGIWNGQVKGVKAVDVRTELQPPEPLKIEA